MSKIRKLIFGLAVPIFFMLPGKAFAVEYTLNVNLTITNVTEITQAQISCQLFSQENQQGNLVGNASTRLTRRDTGQTGDWVINGPITVTVSRSARSYRCIPKVRTGGRILASPASIAEIAESNSVLELKGNISPPQ